MTHPTADDLARVPLFDTLSPYQRREVAGRLTVHRYDAGRAIVTEGRRAYHFHVLVEGRAAVTYVDRQLGVLGPGDFFGEIALVVDSRRTATVTAIEPCVTWEVGRRSFHELALIQPEVTAALELAVRRRLAAG